MDFEIVSGKSISQCCNHIFAEVEFENGVFNIKKNYSIFDKIKSGDSIFVKTDYLTEVFQIMRGINTTIKIVTHESDYSINDDIVASMPKSVDRLYSINAITSSDKVVPIPLGIANDYCKITLKPQNLKKTNVKDCKAIISCNISNNSKERQPLYQNFIDDMVTVSKITSLDVYENLLEEHSFVFCPEGNGPDTHRLWETLYLGKVPIVKTSSWNRNFRDLPIMFVNSLLDAKKEIRNSFISRELTYEFNTQKLNTSYWETIINEC